MLQRRIVEPPQYYRTIQYSDVNGDGKKDVCARGTSGIYCGLSTGHAFLTLMRWSARFSDAELALTAQGNVPQYYSTIRVVGKTLCARAIDGIWCNQTNATNTAFEELILSSETESDTNTSGWEADPAYYSTITLTDDLSLFDRGTQGIMSDVKICPPH